MPGKSRFGGKARPRGLQLELAQVTVTTSVANASNPVTEQGLKAVIFDAL